MKWRAYWVYLGQRTVSIEVSLEAFAATEFNQLISGSVAVCAGGLVLPTHQHALKIGTEVVP